MSRDEWTVRDGFSELTSNLSSIYGGVDDGLASVAGQISSLCDAICRERTDGDRALGADLDLTEAVGRACFGFARIANALERIADALEKK